jgi:hypothetical protein
LLIPPIIIPDEIMELAGQLDNNPALIYVYIRDEVEYVPYYGLMKGSLWTMWEAIITICEALKRYLYLLD